MVDEQAQAQVNEAYRALGRYIYEFSRLQFVMRHSIHMLFNKRGNDLAQLVDLLTGQDAAYDLANGFFGIFASLRQLDPAEKSVATKLRARVIDAATHRNNVTHGDWFIGWGSDGVIDDPMLHTVKAARSGSAREAPRYSAADMDQWSDDLVHLRERVAEYASILGDLWGEGVERRVTDFLIIREGEVRREGPEVGESSFYGW